MTEKDLRKILVVDDAPENIAVLSQVLRDTYRVTAATSGTKALELAESSDPPDLVLLDVMMPDMSGLEVCRRLKANAATAKIPVIFVTSKDEVSDESAGFSAGAADYVVKPVNPELIKARVKAHIELKLAREDLEQQNDILRENVRLRMQVEAINRHDLKGPLIAVMNAPTLLAAGGELTEVQTKRVKMIQEAGRKMLDMINRTIDMYKMEMGTYQCTKVSVDLLRVARQVTESLAPLVDAKKLQVDLFVAGRPASMDAAFVVETEELLVYSLLVNLLKNAAEASPSGARLSISLERRNEPVIEIHNDGSIPRGVQEVLFQKLVVENDHRGSGFGAYSAQLIARTLGGNITFETSEEAGTTVTVHL